MEARSDLGFGVFDPGVRRPVLRSIPKSQIQDRKLKMRKAVSAMQMTEDIIRSVVQEVLSQMGNGAVLGNGKAPGRSSGNLGVFAAVDDAVRAADAAFQVFQTRPLEDRRKAVEGIRRVCVDQAEELGRLELEETQIGRLDHKISKLREAIPLVPGVEYLRTDNDADDG